MNSIKRASLAAFQSYNALSNMGVTQGMSGIEITQADREAARQFIADEWPSWDHDHQTVSAQLMVAFARHRHEARAEALAEAAEMAMLERVEGVEGNEEDAAYNRGVWDAATAILAAR